MQRRPTHAHSPDSYYIYTRIFYTPVHVHELAAGVNPHNPTGQVTMAKAGQCWLILTNAG